MKTLLIIICSLTLIHFGATSQVTVYQIAFRSIDTGNIKLSDYNGKKILVFGFDAANPDTAQLLRLDRLYRANGATLTVIGIPLKDLSAGSSMTDLGNYLKASLGLSFPISQISKGKKSNGRNQHPLLQWLTNNSQNSHFDNDISSDGEIYVISEQGTLFADLAGKLDARGSLINKAIGMKVSNY